jgi:hypothetical protein
MRESGIVLFYKPTKPLSTIDHHLLKAAKEVKAEALDKILKIALMSF